MMRSFALTMPGCTVWSEAERVADGHDGVAHRERVGVAEARTGSLVALT